ncbi:MAG: DUF1553 domain-containing protein [Pedosphaera sp.]|nr:DUF1553 domain-containing protein [Pedosphaera sp.]
MFMSWSSQMFLESSAVRLVKIACMVVVFSTPFASEAAPVDHWSFQPVRPQNLPKVQNKSWVKNPIDRFVLSSLEANELEPALPARREQLIRRVTCDLIGLPPTPEDIDAFIEDHSPNAYEKLVDRLLASPQYGERWARHWLDLARYAESDGFEHDAVRPNSWRYRDYVIRSFNEDKPYDQFLREQIAGDELFATLKPEAQKSELLVATAFNLLGPDMVDSADQVQRRLNTLNDMTDATASVFLGLTFGCARCHDHKFEPITQRDYFSMQAFFAPALFHQDRPIPTVGERAAHDTAQVAYKEASRALQSQIDGLEAPHRESLFSAKLAKLSEDAALAHQTPKSQRTVEQENTVQETAGMVKITDAEIAERMSATDKERRKNLLEELKKIPKPPALPATLALSRTNGAPPRTFILNRGDYNQPGDEVQPGFPVLLDNSRGNETQTSLNLARTRSTASPKSSLSEQRKGGDAVERIPTGMVNQSLLASAATNMNRRTALADWLTSSANPLTARVMANRIWQHHFGRGLVATPSDFGTRGARPTNPPLLDWLASEFFTSGWSIKAMHRLILTSAAYQQSSETSPAALARDPENKFLSHQNRTRLEGEAIRDSLLATSARLNPAMSGPSILPPLPADLASSSKSWTTSADAADYTRRSIYVFARRNLRFPFFEAFDAPDNNLTCPERGRSVTAPQALTLLNSEEVLTAANATAARLLREATSTNDRIHRAFRLILGRAPTGSELEKSRAFLRDRGNLDGANQETTQTAFAALCRALFNLNAFVFVE